MTAEGSRAIWMKNWKISTQLRAAFAAIIFFAVGTGSVVYTQTADVQELFTDVVERRMPVLHALDEIRNAVNLQNNAELKLALATTVEERQVPLAMLESQQMEARTQIEFVKSNLRTDRGTQLIAAVDAAQTAYVADVTSYRALVLDNQSKQALELLGGKLHDSRNTYLSAQEELYTFVLANTTEMAVSGLSEVTSAHSIQAFGALLTLLIGAVLSLIIIRNIQAPVREAVSVANAIAGGDLSYRFSALQSNEMVQLLAALQKMQDTLRQVINSVHSGAETVASASFQIAQGNQDLSNRTEQQASALEETAAAMTELNEAVRQTDSTSKIAAELAQESAQVVQQGGRTVAQVVESMRKIQDSAHKIADITGLIDGIAFQTNILALNAAVEAARAGDQGRGFAVVASEVRALAKRSAEAAKEIKQLIDGGVIAIDDGTHLANAAGATMAKVVVSIQETATVIGSISAASTKQSAEVGHVRQLVTSMDTVTQQNAALVEEMAAAASSLSQQAQSLVGSVSAFSRQGSR